MAQGAVARESCVLRITYGLVLGLSVLASSLSFMAAAPALAQSFKDFQQEGYSFKYPQSWGDVKFSKVAAQALDSPTDIPDDVAPAHVECRFSASNSEIYIYPLKGVQSPDFKKKFPVVTEATQDLKTLLQRKTAAPKEIPLLPWMDTGTSMNARIKYLVDGNVHFVRYLSQYNPEPTPFNNADLVYAAQGLTKDDKYYVSAYLHAKAEGLADTRESDHWSKNKFQQFSKNFPKYSADMLQKLSKMNESAFTPPLSQFDQVVASIKVPAN